MIRRLAMACALLVACCAPATAAPVPPVPLVPPVQSVQSVQSATPSTTESAPIAPEIGQDVESAAMTIDAAGAMQDIRGDDASEPNPDMASAVAAYRAGRYAEASMAFARLADAEPDATRAGVLHCNAGTAAARDEQLGEALWQLRRARMLLPRDPQASANLERVRALLAASAGSPAVAASSDTTTFVRTLRDLPLHATLDESGTACAIVAGVALLLLAGWRAARLPRAMAGVALTLLCMSLAWWFLARAGWEHEERRAVVIAASVNGRAEPSAESETLFHLAAGTVLTAEEQRGAWRLVQSDTNARGWVPADEVRPLR